MAIAYVRSTGVFRAGGALSASGSFGSLPTVGNMVVVLVSRSGSSGATLSVSDNQGNTYTKAVESATVGPCNTSSIWYAPVGTSSGTFTVTVTNTGTAGSSYISATALEYSGLASSSVVDQTNSNSGTGIGTLSSGSITTTNADDLLIGVCCSNKSTNQTWTDPGAPWTQRFIESGGANYEMGIGNERIVSATGTYSVSWSIDTTGGDLTASIASFKMASSGSAITINCSVGDASAAGVSSIINSAANIACSVGNAAAAGITASINGGVSLSCSVGNATAAGTTATINAASSVACTVGNAVAAGTSAAIHTMTLHADYERSSVNLSSSSITGTGDSAVILIWPRMQSSEVSSGVTAWLEPSAKVTGVNGYKPTFRFGSYLTSGAGKYWGQPWDAGRKPMYSYDQVTWTYFDTTSIDTVNHWIQFSNSTAFTGDTVYIGRGRQRTVTQTGNWIATLAGTYSFVGPTASALAFTPSTTTGFPAQAYIADEFSTQTDELSATVPATPFYAFEINDTSLMPTSGGPKKLAIVLGGVHAGEDLSNIVLEKCIEYICGGTAAAQTIRRNFRLLVYPMMNAPGRYGGHWRGSFQTASGYDDANRHFGDGTALEIISKPIAAWTTDIAGKVPSWMIDFHGQFSSTLGCYTDYAGAVSIRNALNAYETYTDLGSSPLTGCTEDYWNRIVGTQFVNTLEYGDPAGLTDSAITTTGQNIAKAFADLQAAYAFGNEAFASPTSDTSAGAWTPSTGVTLYGCVDEVPANDADYIQTSSASTCEMGLAPLTDPVSSAGHVLHYRLLAGSGAVTVTLKQGATTIATFGPHTLSGAAQEFAQTLSGVQADSITNYGALSVAFAAA